MLTAGVSVPPKRQPRARLSLAAAEASTVLLKRLFEQRGHGKGHDLDALIG